MNVAYVAFVNQFVTVIQHVHQVSFVKIACVKLGAVTTTLVQAIKLV